MAKVIMTVSSIGDEVVGISFSNAKSVKEMFKRIMEQTDVDDFASLSDLLGIKLDFSTNEKIVKSLNRYYKQLYKEASNDVEYFKNVKTKASLVDTKSMKNIKKFLEEL